MNVSKQETVTDSLMQIGYRNVFSDLKALLFMAESRVGLQTVITMGVLSYSWQLWDISVILQKPCLVTYQTAQRMLYFVCTARALEVVTQTKMAETLTVPAVSNE